MIYLKDISKLFLLIASFLMFSITACSDDSTEKPVVPPKEKVEIDVKPDMNLIGSVYAGDTPLVNVVVSDGYTTTLTDEKGIYQMKAHRNTKFVFVSIPEDCKIPMDAKGSPKIYEPIESVFYNKVLRKDFELEKAPVQKNFTLLALADVQIGDKLDLDSLTLDMPKIVKYVETLPEPVYGISLGDLVWDNLPYFSEYTKHVNTLNIPVFSVIGNHDHDMTVIDDDEASAKSFEDHFGPTYYSYNIGDVHFVVLDDVYYSGGANKTYSGKITQEQIDWLKEDLKHVSKDKLIILGTHIATKRRNNTLQVSNNKDLYAVLDGYKVRILSGHSHNNYTTTISENIEENTLGAVMGGGWNGDLCNDGAPKGFAVYSIKGNEITNWYYKGTNHDKDYQMNLYNIGEAVTDKYKDGFILNVFSWHTTWTVNVKLDGEVVKTFAGGGNMKEIDRMAYDHMEGKYKPDRRPSTEPEQNNDHMFYYKPTNPDWKIAEIEAVTPYGVIYRGEMKNQQDK